MSRFDELVARHAEKVRAARSAARDEARVAREVAEDALNDYDRRHNWFVRLSEGCMKLKRKRGVAVRDIEED